MAGMKMQTAEIPIVKLSSTAALLAYLPVLAGVPYRNRLVIAPFVGKHSSRAMRITTERSPSPASARVLASAALETLSRLDDCDSVAVAVYRDEPFQEIGRQWYDAIGVILERLHQSGYHVRDAAIVAGDGWVPYFEPDLDAPRPLDEIEAHAKQLPFPPHADVAQSLPQADRKLAQRVDDLVYLRQVEHSEPDAFGRLRPVTPLDPIRVLEEAMNGDPAETSAHTLARVIAQIDSEGAVDRTVLQIAFGADVGAQSWSSTLALRDSAAAAGCTPNDILMEEFERGEVSSTAQRLSRLLGGETRKLPSRERLHAGAVLLGRATAHAPLSHKLWLLCAFAWLQWALGLSSAANETIVAARRLDPRNSLAPVYHTVFDQMKPQWIFTSTIPNRATRRRRSRKSR